MVPVTFEQRKMALAAAVRAEVLKGAAVQSQSDFDAVVIYPKKTPGCLMSIVLFCVTCHLYGYYWIWARLAPPKRRMMMVNEFGQVVDQKLKR